MGLLNRYFTSPEALAKQIVAEGTRHEEILREYVASALQKRGIIQSLNQDNYAQQLPSLKKLLQTELVELGEAEKSDEKLMANLRAFDHRKEIKRAERLDACLGYVEMKEEHVHYFLVQLFHTLRSELGAVLLLEKKAGDTGELIQKLKELWTVEKGLLDQMSSRDSAHNKVFVDAGSFKPSVVRIFSALVRGEHIIHAMDKNMRRLVKEIIPKMRKAGNFYWLFADAIFEAIEAHIHDLVASGEDLYHPNSNFDIVNRPDFIDRVVRPVNEKFGNRLSEEELKAFVLIFRNWYNKGNLD